MPMIHASVSVPLNASQRESVKSKFGKAITCIPGKSEQWLMVHLEDNCDLYFQGNKKAPSAFVDVQIYGSASASAYDRLTASICKILEDELSIPQSRIYVKYGEVEHWGWNGGNF